MLLRALKPFSGEMEHLGNIIMNTYKERQISFHIICVTFRHVPSFFYKPKKLRR